MSSVLVEPPESDCLYLSRLSDLPQEVLAESSRAETPCQRCETLPVERAAVISLLSGAAAEQQRVLQAAAESL